MAELHELADPDAAQGRQVDDLVAEAAEVAGVPMATLNLIDADRQCAASTSGFEGAVTARSEAMCSVVLDLGTAVHVPDASRDPRFAGSPWVDGRRGEVRFYFSAPLVTRRGLIIATLCVFDIVPHELSQGQISRLQGLARRVVEVYEARRVV